MPVLAIDQGTTGTRALVSESAGTGRIICVFEHRQHYPQPGWVEHDPEELVRNIQQCVDLGLKQFPDISDIGIDNQGESCLAWDADTKQAISPIIVWQDSRTQAAIESLQSDGLGKVVLELSGPGMSALGSPRGGLVDRPVAGHNSHGYDAINAGRHSLSCN